MSAVVSVARVPELPAIEQYPLSALYLYQVWTRKSYEDTFGVQPSAYDPTKPIKRWFATDAVAFTVFDYDKKAFVSLSMPSDAAASVNLPGSYRYDTYSEPVNRATWMLMSSLVTKTSGFARLADATRVASELGGKVVEGKTPMGTPYAYDSPDSRVYTVVTASGSYDASVLMLSRAQRGLWHPGSWLTTGAVPVFVPTPDYSDPQEGMLDKSLPAEYGVPCRALTADEELRTTPYDVQVVRKSLQQVTQTPGSGLTNEQSKTLDEVHAMLQSIVKFLQLT